MKGACLPTHAARGSDWGFHVTGYCPWATSYQSLLTLTSSPFVKYSSSNNGSNNNYFTELRKTYKNNGRLLFSSMVDNMTFTWLTTYINTYVF